MFRERLEGILRQELPERQLRERGIKEIMDEFDRQAALIAQFVELARDFVAWNEIDLMALDALKDRARALIEESQT